MNREDATDDQERFYRDAFLRVNYSGATGIATQLIHRSLEWHWSRQNFFQTVVELGAAHGGHLPHVRHGFDQWILTDLVNRDIDVEALTRDVSSGSGLRSVRFEVQDATHLGFEDASINRVVHTCLLHHVWDVAQVFREIRRVLKPGGIYSAYIPCDPGLAYRALQRATAGRAIRKALLRGNYAISAQQLRALEHPNHFAAIFAQLEAAFRNDEMRALHVPLPAPLWNLNLFTVVQVRRT